MFMIIHYVSSSDSRIYIIAFQQFQQYSCHCCIRTSVVSLCIMFAVYNLFHNITSLYINYGFYDMVGNPAGL